MKNNKRALAALALAGVTLGVAGCSGPASNSNSAPATNSPAAVSVSDEACPAGNSYGICQHRPYVPQPLDILAGDCATVITQVNGQIDAVLSVNPAEISGDERRLRAVQAQTVADEIAGTDCAFGASADEFVGASENILNGKSRP